MKARLMYPDRDFDLYAPQPRQADDLIRDLGLDTLVAAMAGEDEFLAKVATAALVTSLDEPAVIAYRQRVLDDCLRVPSVARDLYDLAGEALQSRRKIWAPFGSDSPTTALHASVEVLQLYVGFLRRLRELAERYRPEVRSAGLTAVLDVLMAELSDEYFAEVDEHLEMLKFRQGILMTARLDPGGRGTGYVLRRIRDDRNWFARLLSLPEPNALTFTIPERDDAGWQALASLRDEGMVLVARAVGEAAEHVQSFFTMLRRETGFYVGCLNLHEQLVAREAPVCFPQPQQPGTSTLVCRGLYEPGLRLRQDGTVVGNDITGDHLPLIMVTGANQGGKSTFLRSVGIAQLMMQSGMFVSAESFTATAYRAIFTHFRREEDASMESGKLDEELARMSEVIDRMGSGAVLLSNESFSSTNEREGSQIARHVFRGLTAAGVSVVAVTHLFDLASTLYEQEQAALFLRAERRDDGSRTFRLVEGRPLTTGFGEDLYARIFGAAEPEAAPAG